MNPLKGRNELLINLLASLLFIGSIIPTTEIVVNTADRYPVMAVAIERLIVNR